MRHPGLERRRSPRYLCSHLVVVLTDVSLPGLLEDLSREGAGIALEAPLPIGAEVELLAGDLRTGAQVRYCLARETDFRIGVEFLNGVRWQPDQWQPDHLFLPPPGATPMSDQPTPEHILQTGLGFWASKTLLSAVEIGLFTELAKGPADLDTVQGRLGLHRRSARDFLDALVALGFLSRTDGRYHNTPAADLYLDRRKSSYVGGILEMANHRLYPFWGHLTEALRTGLPQNEAKGGGASLFATLYADPARLKQFLAAMTGLSHGSNLAVARKFPFDRYKTFADIGTAQGDTAVQIALAHPHMSGSGFDLPEIAPIFEEYVERHKLSGRVRFTPGDFFADPLPTADVLVMGHILHDWSLDEKTVLLRRAFDALPGGGALIVYESIIDDDRSKNAFGLLMSLNMLIETHTGFDYTGADCIQWMREVGFREARVEHLVGPESMVVGTK
jgi:O-methyltransferase/methyltransferase family protein/PilZ domain-containing protein